MNRQNTRRAPPRIVIALAGALAAAAAAPAHAETIAEYTFAFRSFSPTTVAPGITASDINALGSLAIVEPGNPVPDTLFLGITPPATDPDQAVANDQFFQFTVAPEAGYQFDLSTLSFIGAKGGSSSPRGWVLRSSLDDFGSTIATSVIEATSPTFEWFGVDLGSAFRDVDTDLTFRVYGFAPPTSGIGLFFDNIVLDGQVALAPVPEPATFGLMGLGLAALAFKRRRA